MVIALILLFFIKEIPLSTTTPTQEGLIEDETPVALSAQSKNPQASFSPGAE